MKVNRPDELVKSPDYLPEHVFVDLDGLWRRTRDDMPRHLRARGAPQLARGSHAKLLELLDPEGSRPADVAARAGITKQAVGTQLRELEELGLVRFSPDPADGRAVLVRRTRAGDAVRRSSRRAVAAMEQEWATQVGAERYATFREVLRELADPGLTEWVRDRRG